MQRLTMHILIRISRIYLDIELGIHTKPADEHPNLDTETERSEQPIGFTLNP